MEVQKENNIESIKSNAGKSIQYSIKNDKQMKPSDGVQTIGSPSSEFIKPSQIPSPLSTEFSQSYIDYGTLLLVDYSIEKQFLQCIVNALPENYIGVDIGSCDGKLGRQIMNVKKGKIISVDPYPISADIVNSTGQDFLKLNQETYDCIIFKYSIHFFEDFEQLYHDITRSLKPPGKLFILTTLSQSYFPWSDEIHKGFASSCKNTQNIYKNCDVKQTNLQAIKKLTTQQFKKFLQKKGFSNLYLDTEEQIKRSIQSLPDSDEVEIILRQRILQISNKKPKTQQTKQ